MSLTNEITLNQDETVIKELQGSGYIESNNPFERLLMSIIRILSLLIGKRNVNYVIVTNQRVFIVAKNMIFWFLDTETSAMSLNQSAINAVGYSKVRKFLIFSTLYFTINTKNGIYKIRFKGKLGELNALISTMIHLI